MHAVFKNKHPTGLLFLETQLIEDHVGEHTDIFDRQTEVQCCDLLTMTIYVSYFNPLALLNILFKVFCHTWSRGTKKMPYKMFQSEH